MWKILYLSAELESSTASIDYVTAERRRLGVCSLHSKLLLAPIIIQIARPLNSCYPCESFKDVSNEVVGKSVAVQDPDELCKEPVNVYINGTGHPGSQTFFIL